jgi:hypothetical protein
LGETPDRALEVPDPLQSLANGPEEEGLLDEAADQCLAFAQCGEIAEGMEDPVA